MKKIEIYTTKYCGFCQRAKALLTQKGMAFQEIPVDTDLELRRRISEKAGGFPTVPMVFIDDEFVGGYTELSELEKEGKL